MTTTPAGGWARPNPSVAASHAAPVVNRDRVITDDEVKALIAIETMERLITRAGNLLVREGREEADVVAAALMLDEARSIASTRTCTAVKTQALSDSIAQTASTFTAQALARVRATTG